MNNEPYVIQHVKRYLYNEAYGDERICKCGHVYHRHFDSYADMEPVGCKYCRCIHFVEEAINCCCSYGAAVAGEWPEFECFYCERHQNAFQMASPEGNCCKAHRRKHLVMTTDPQDEWEIGRFK